MSNYEHEPSESPEAADEDPTAPPHQAPEQLSPAPKSAAAKTLETLELAVRSMREELEANRSRAQAREGVISSLHEQVQKLRSGDRASVVRPLVVDLGHLRNTILSQVDEAGLDISAISLAGYADEIEFILERQGILPSHPAPGDPVQIGEHKVVGLEPTGTFDAGETVARVHGDGYYDTVDERMVMPAEIVAYRYDPDLAAPIMADPALPDSLLVDFGPAPDSASEKPASTNSSPSDAAFPSRTTPERDHDRSDLLQNRPRYYQLGDRLPRFRRRTDAHPQPPCRWRHHSVGGLYQLRFRSGSRPSRQQPGTAIPRPGWYP